MDNFTMTQRTLPQAVKVLEPVEAKKQKAAEQPETRALREQKQLNGDNRAIQEKVPDISREIPARERKAGQVQQEQAEEHRETQRREAQGKYNQVMAEKAVENANQRVHSMGKSAKFEYNDKINRITITISDKSSKEVIREIPPEATQKMLERIHTMRGMMMDTEA